jgi:hypothetical protein
LKPSIDSVHDGRLSKIAQLANRMHISDVQKVRCKWQGQGIWGMNAIAVMKGVPSLAATIVVRPF